MGDAGMRNPIVPLLLPAIFRGTSRVALKINVNGPGVFRLNIL